MYHDEMIYQKISNVLNEEQVLGKINWRDSTIVHILENPIYKETLFIVKEQNIQLIMKWDYK